MNFANCSVDALEERFWSLVTAFNATDRDDYARQLTALWFELKNRGRLMPDARDLSPQCPCAW